MNNAALSTVTLPPAHPPRLWLRVAAALMASYCLYVLGMQIATMLDFSLLHEEHRLLFTHHRLREPALFAGDLFLETLQPDTEPLFYQWLNRFWIGTLQVEPLHYHHLLPLVLYGVLLLAYALVGHKLAGHTGALMAVGMAILHPEFLNTITAVRPHSFIYPLLALFLAAMLYGRVGFMAWVTLLAGGLYLPAAMVCGVQFTLYLGFRHLPAGRDVPAAMRALLLLTCTGLATLWLVWKGLGELPSTGYMHSLEGWWIHTNYVFNRLEDQYPDFFGAFARIPAVLTLLLMFLGLNSLPTTPLASRLQCFWWGIFGLWAGLSLWMPSESYRLLLYPLVTLIPVLLPFGLARLGKESNPVAPSPHGRRMLLGMLCLACLLQSTDRVPLGYLYQIPQDAGLRNFAASLPESTRVAGWPNNSNTLNEFFPYLFKRPAFLLFKMVVPLNEAYFATIRQRMHDLISAYLATDVEALRTLHERWGVDYLIVQKIHFKPGATAPAPLTSMDVFEPFNQLITRLWGQHTAEDFVLAHPPAGSIAYENETIRILNLARL